MKADSAALELPKFRYVDDVARFVNRIQADTRDLSQVATLQQKQLAKLKTPKQAALASLAKASLALKKKAPQPKITAASLAKLDSQYSISEDLYRKYRAVEMAEAQLAAQFPDRGRSYAAVMGSIHALKTDVSTLMRQTLGFLNEVAEAHAPADFQKFTASVMDNVGKRMKYEGADNFLYISASPEGAPVFTAYRMFANACNTQGNAAPHLYVSAQWTVGAAVQVQVNHEFEQPAALLRAGGTQVNSAAEASKILAMELAMEGFAVSE
ncbi:hypothetical protein [Burkholderia phage BCSR5]|nr:hypothetical protein [Burkholderia phage BCSR5]